jgi:DNA-binding XRE family transcriptional regulator
VTGAKLKKLRLSAGWTQAQMAKKLGMSRDGYGRHERNPRRRVAKTLELAVRCLAYHLR